MCVFKPDLWEPINHRPVDDTLMTQMVAYTRTLRTTYSDEGFRRDVEMFLSDLRDKGRRPNTIGTYSRALMSIRRTEEVNGGLIDPRSMTPEDFIRLRDQMTVCEGSRKLYLTVLGRLCRFLTGHNPRMDAGILWNRTGKRRLFITSDQFKVMVMDSTPLEGLVLTLGAYMGLRRCEIADIRLGDIVKGHLTVRGKGHGPEGKVEHIFMPSAVRRAVSDYLPERESVIASTGSTDDHLLLRPTGRRAGDGLAPDTVGDVVRRIAERNGVEMTAHSLRRLFATTMYEGGVDLNTIRMMMRHESVNTTLGCYIEVSGARFESARSVVESALG